MTISQKKKDDGGVIEVLNHQGYIVLPRIVPHVLVDKALRRLNLEIVKRGLSEEKIHEWHHIKCWFPHLRYEPEILALADVLPAELTSGKMCEPQILMHFPDEAEEWPIHPHIDEPPAWANGRGYMSILGVSLSNGIERNGGLVVWPFNRPDHTTNVSLAPGDVVAMHPDLAHAGGLNRSGTIRTVIYFRYLSD
jgi:ectoine hydroxylase-related dioxygenase (phytanoyl-CoA dioxygenase family)